MSNIKIIRLSSGEELISTVKYQSDEDDLNADTLLMLEDTAVLIPTQQNQLGLAPFMPYSDAVKRVAIMGKDVMFVVDPVSELKQQYQEMFKKVVTPDKKIII
jgi:hypothetical protein